MIDILCDRYIVIMIKERKVLPAHNNASYSIRVSDVLGLLIARN